MSSCSSRGITKWLTGCSSSSRSCEITDMSATSPDSLEVSDSSRPRRLWVPEREEERLKVSVEELVDPDGPVEEVSFFCF